ncbi:MAG: DUF1080 domain-containing protein [Planctomycetaceae bacterium]|jgi:hypothetical protein|nr:DUF1080 domain-containing protein [Planctomycetaceae bacterium]MBT6486491.1 DUF1080 domain-containing protein [Planctomycetaceae bacterium]MBT6495814.1 DUF1080 domain-containing protein [Planctomycetaceae bacterium]
MRRSAWFLGMFSAIVLVGAMSAHAQDKKKQAATDISQVDEDYALQGEYFGQARTAANGSWRTGYVGLQVVALGDGKFDAVLYTGGLPGAGWNRRDKQQLSGMREGDSLRLQDGPFTIDVNGRRAEISYEGQSANSRIDKILRISPTVGNRPSHNATVLFDGTNTDLFKNGRMTENGLLMEGADTRDAYRDFTLHLEFRLPYMPHARGQGRSNSGVYLQSRYEVQILDSFGLEGVHNECGGLYKQRPPAVNMCYPPLRWQTYDLTLTSAKFDKSGKKIKNARLTVRHNGELIHDDVELKNKTGAGRPEGPEALPTKLQNHGNPVRFRNIWLVQHDGTPSSLDCPPNQFAQPHGYYARHPRYSGAARHVIDYRQFAHPRYSGGRR